MKKYYKVDDNQEVKMGDIFVSEMKKDLGKDISFEYTFKCPVNEETISYLIEYGYIREEEVNPFSEHTNFGRICTYTINAIAKRMGWDYNKMKQYLIDMNKLYPEALRTTLYRVLSLEMNKTRRTKKVRNFYGIYPTDTKDIVVSFKAVSVNPTDTKRHSFFKDKEDAEYAVEIVDAIIKVFNGKQED